MAAVISLKNLTDKQRKVWRMRYRKGWRMRRIALEMGMSDNLQLIPADFRPGYQERPRRIVNSIHRSG
ncbi:MAG TPA: hypothetical protein VFC46_05435 [Humisphaera sp.]|nr:hypothetical protein [Humisphaera sp.]